VKVEPPTKGEAMHRHIYNLVILILAATLLAACGSSDKGPAEAALRAAEEAINSAKGEASRYAADQVRAAESQLAALREKFNNGDFKAVLSDAPALATKAKDIASAAAAKKA
jgi:major membrane immunogen (membrane-anchored lipoprotein)